MARGLALFADEEDVRPGELLGIQFFHKVSFANDLWRLDASRDYLVIMFPDGLWFDATLFVAFVAIGGALLLSAAAGGYLLVRRHRIRREKGSVLPQQEKGLRV